MAQTMTFDPKQLNGIALAYMGDAVYEVYIREHLLKRGLVRPASLQRAAKDFVSAKAQAALIAGMEEANLLDSDETDIFKARAQCQKLHAREKYRCGDLSSFNRIRGTVRLLTFDRPR